MPALELTQETGKLVAWRKEEGEPVAKGEVLLEVETDKAVVEIEAAADGILAGVKAVAGDIIPVGKTIAWIISPGETPPQEDAPPDSAKTAGWCNLYGQHQRLRQFGSGKASCAGTRFLFRPRESTHRSSSVGLER